MGSFVRRRRKLWESGFLSLIFLIGSFCLKLWPVRMQENSWEQSTIRNSRSSPLPCAALDALKKEYERVYKSPALSVLVLWPKPSYIPKIHVYTLISRFTTLFNSLQTLQYTKANMKFSVATVMAFLAATAAAAPVAAPVAAPERTYYPKALSKI